MSVGVILGLCFAGFAVGNLVFAAVARWLYALHELRKAPQSERRMGVFFAAVLSSGPWMVIAAALFAYYVRSEAWAPWLFVGFLSAIGFFTLLIIRVARNRRARDREGLYEPYADMNAKRQNAA